MRAARCRAPADPLDRSTAGRLDGFRLVPPTTLAAADFAGSEGTFQGQTRARRCHGRAGCAGAVTDDTGADEVVVYCARGPRADAWAARQPAGRRVAVLDGGFEAWRREGLPVSIEHRS